MSFFKNVGFAMWDLEGKPLVINTHAGNRAYIFEMENCDLVPFGEKACLSDNSCFLKRKLVL